MSQITSVLGNEPGIQFNRSDESAVLVKEPTNNVIVGQFKRGRTDQVMTITKHNIRAVLGYEPKNPFYVAVQDALDANVTSVSVLRTVEDVTPPVISATYDSFYQTITVTGPVGLVVETKDPENNTIGSGVIGSGGGVTYKIEEGLLPKDTIISTSSANSNVINHNLLTSFYFARDAGAWYPYVFVQRDLNNGWIGQSSDDYLPNNISGEIIVEYDNEQYLVDLSDFAGEQQILLKKSGASAYPYSYDAKSTNDLTKVKIRFRNVNSELFLQIGQADHFYKFFDDGVQKVGYQLAWRNSPTHDDIVIKEIPNYLPATVHNLNAMFWGDAEDSYLFDSADTESKLALWDFSNVTKMITTFAYSKFYDLPISNLTLTNLVYAIETFAASNFNKAINWITPALQSVCYMFGDNIVFNSNIDMTFDNVTDASSFLQGASLFNKPLQHLNTSKVENFSYFLYQCLYFNQAMDLLDVSSCKNFNSFFEGCTNYNQPMPSWNLASLVNTPYSSGLYGFLKNALNFAQDLSMWCVTPHPTEPSGFNQNGIMTVQQKPVWGTCPVPVDTSWDIEYVLGGVTTRQSFSNHQVPYQYTKLDTSLQSITSLKINSTVNGIGYEGLYQCTLATSLEFGSQINLTTIPTRGFFKWSACTTLNLPSTLVEIGMGAFHSWTALTSLVIPSSVRTIKYDAFYSCSKATSLTINQGTQIIEERAFFFWEKATAPLVIPEGVTNIGAEAFAYWLLCTGLTLPSTLTAIAQRSFWYWQAAPSLVIPEGVTYIGYESFRYWTVATTLVIPSTVTTIEGYAFHDWNAIASITVKAVTPPTLTMISGQLAFAFNKTAPIYVPAGSVNAYKADPNWSLYSSRIFAMP